MERRVRHGPGCACADLPGSRSKGSAERALTEEWLTPCRRFLGGTIARHSATADLSRLPEVRGSGGLGGAPTRRKRLRMYGPSWPRDGFSALLARRLDGERVGPRGRSFLRALHVGVRRRARSRNGPHGRGWLGQWLRTGLRLIGEGGRCREAEKENKRLDDGLHDALQAAPVEEASKDPLRRVPDCQCRRDGASPWIRGAAATSLDTWETHHAAGPEKR